MTFNCINSNSITYIIIGRMAWYQSQLEQSQWKKMIENPNLTIVQILDSQQFEAQLIKHGNPDVFAWMQKKHKYFFEQLLIRCLILPKEGDSDERKYKQPTQSVALLCSVLKGLVSNMPNAGSGLPLASVICSMTNNDRKPISHEIITFVVEKMFSSYSQNDATQLLNTLIPGYFNQIFQCLNTFHTAVLIHVLRTTQQGRLQKLLDQHGQYQQVVKCIQTILVVFISPGSGVVNLQGSVTFSSTPMVHAQPQPTNSSQPNHPYETKHKILMAILGKMKNYKKFCDPLVLQNLTAVLLEIIKNVGKIFEGSMLAQYIWQSESAKIFFEIALCNYKIFAEEGLECQIKCMELLKYCVHLMTPIDRSNLLPKFEQIIKIVLATQRPNLKVNSFLQLLNQWFLAESNQNTNILASLKDSLRGSMGMSLSGGSQDAAKAAAPGISPQVQQLLIGTRLFQHVLRQCVRSPNCNIFHQRVSNFILTVFKSQNNPIIDSIFKENDIIKQTILNITNFKQNPYFGYFVVIIECYTTRRVDTPTVNQTIQANTDIWNQFYFKVLEPHVKQKLIHQLGKMEDLADGEVVEFTTIRSQQQRKTETEKTVQQASISNSIKDVNKQQNPEKTQSQKLNENISEQNVNQKQSLEEPIQPILINFIKKQSENSENAEQKQESQSFQNFMKRKLGESNALVDERKKSKSRTPTKIIAGQSKRKKWGGDPESSLSPGPQIRKTISADQRVVPKQSACQQVIPKIVLTRLNKTNLPKYSKQRKMNAQNDSRLMRWLERSKRSVKSIR